MSEQLHIIRYPDPRLKKKSLPVTEFDAGLRQVADRMFELMREARGVGLAAPQVGLNIRLFVMNATGKPEDDRVYVNPVLSDADGSEDVEEGCLSIPDVLVKVNRPTARVTMRAQDLSGQPFEQTEEGFVTRVWQHETDHLNGVMLTDRMGPVAKLTYRKKLRELEEEYAADQARRKPKVASIRIP